MKYQDLLQAIGKERLFRNRTTVLVQGLGHVGSAMSAVVAMATDAAGKELYNVVGLELDNPAGRQKVDDINAGVCPIKSTDERLNHTIAQHHELGNLVATTNQDAISIADIVIVDIPFDVAALYENPSLDWAPFRSALESVAERIRPGALILVETTVPPGTCAKVVAPIVAQSLKDRGLEEDCVHIAHSYERVMPGADYLHSIRNFWRVFAGLTEEAGDRCQAFLESVLNTTEFPLCKLSHTTASETAKVLENSYRAVNIAFIDEFSRFAETAGVNLFEVIDAIRVRPTHSNIRFPGFGVGGYCLTKDPLMAKLAAHDLFGTELPFQFSSAAVSVNKAMPGNTVHILETELGPLDKSSVALLGVSYRQDVGDTRYSPSEDFVRMLRKRDCTVDVFDPLVNYWSELEIEVSSDIDDLEKYDAIVVAVPHVQYHADDFVVRLGEYRGLIVDANGVFSNSMVQMLRSKSARIKSIGRGDL